MPAPERPVRVVLVNRKARHEFEILESLEAGLMLKGTEVKTLRAGRASLEEAYVRPQGRALVLVGAHIAEYEQGNIHNHDPRRDRRLLVHGREGARWARRVREKGLTIVPLRIYFRGPWAKVELALARGRRLHDKREALRRREQDRELQAFRGGRGRRGPPG